MHILSSISNSLDFWSVNHTIMWGSNDLNVFKNIKFVSEPNHLFGANIYKTCDSCW